MKIPVWFTWREALAFLAVLMFVAMTGYFVAVDLMGPSDLACRDFLGRACK